MGEISIPKLRETFQGGIIAPEDAEYDKARMVFYAGIDKKPAVIIRVADINDVQKAIALARDTGLELAIRSGGHSVAGYSVVDNGIVIDFHNMKQIEIDAKERTAWVEAGTTALELTNAVDKHDLVIGFGDTGSVGIGGITLGGGVGFLVRKFGLTIDNLLAAEVVTADGNVLHVDGKNHPDLFWAIRGGGGNFGVVTKFKYRLNPLGQAMGGLLLLPAEPKVLAGFMAEAEKAPEELSTIANVMPAPPMPFVPETFRGKLCIMALMMYAGDPRQGERVFASFRDLVHPIADMIKPIRYREIFFPEDESYHPSAVSQTMFMKKVDSPVAKLIIERLEATDVPMRAVQFRVLGGAMARVPVSDTAFAHRNSKIMINVAAFYITPEEKRARAKWAAEFSRMLLQGDSSVYVGFLGSEDDGRILDAYPKATWERLVAVKRRYDPNNLFRHNLNIQPGTGIRGRN